MHNMNRFKKKFFAIITMFLLSQLYSVSLAYCKGAPVYKTAIVSDPISIDPKDIRNFSATLVGSQVLEGLVGLDESLNVVPAIAESWVISDDGRTTTFKIRRGVKFHDGSEVTSKDVAYSLSRIVKEEGDNLFFRTFDNIDGAKEYRSGKVGNVRGIVPLDDRTLEIKLIHPNPLLYKVLSTLNCAVIPNGFAESKNNNTKTKPVSVGPFKVVDWKKGNRIVLSRNDEYYGIQPNIEKLIFEIMPENKIIEAFDRGEIYDTFGLSVYKDVVVNNSDNIMVEEKLPILHFIALNQKIKPLDNIYLRKALHYGLDKKRLVLEVFGVEDISNSTIPYGIGGYSPALSAYEYSPNKARDMLKRSGLSKETLGKKMIIYGRDLIPNKDVFKKIIENNYSSIGLNVEVQFISTQEFLNRFYKKSLGIFYAFHNINMNDALFVLAWYESKTALNFTNMAVNKFDLLMDIAREEHDDYTRSRLYAKADEIIKDEAVQMNLFNKVFRGYINRRVRNFKIAKIGPVVEYKYVWLEQ